MRVIFLPSRDEFTAEARVLIHFKHVHAGMRNAGCYEFVQRMLPACPRLVRQSGDQVHINIRNSGTAQPGDVVENGFAIVQAAYGSRFLVNERLHAQADPVHSASNEALQHFLRKRTRRALYGDFRAGVQLKILLDGDKDGFELVYSEKSRGATAEIN